MGTRLRKGALQSRGGGGAVAAADKRGFPQTILMPTLKPWLLLNETAVNLEGGLEVGTYWPCHDGGYRICQAKEDLSPARATFWAGAEEGRTSSAAGTKTILAVKKGHREVYVETTGSYEAGDFKRGLFRVTGGLATVTGRQFMIANNDKSYASSEISGDANRYITKITLADYLDIDLTQDADWHIQSNMFSCQRHAPGDIASSTDDDTDQPRFTIGVPLVPVKADEYFWCQVYGSATGQLLSAITSTNCTSGKVDLMPYIGASGEDGAPAKGNLGKLQAIDAASDIPSEVFARLLVRKQTAFSAGAYVPIWLYGNAAV